MKKVKDAWMVRVLYGCYPEDSEYTLPKIYESRDDAEKAFHRYQLEYGERLIPCIKLIKFISK